MGSAAIEICNLNRRRLRKQQVRLVINVIETFRPDRDLQTVVALVRELLGTPDQRYAAVTRAVCDQPVVFGLA